METAYKPAPGVQVREEDFGLLFYKMKGPRLFFLPSGDLLEEVFFYKEIPLGEWFSQKEKKIPENTLKHLQKALKQLTEKGVILEC